MLGKNSGYRLFVEFTKPVSMTQWTFDARWRL
ncbi:hypothetical protein CA85_52840 [Allorhodopirellula solitaria]|uniref:Uncharacterized protein n=1 Tax=Allorhodopirellula solitaria TaxID=2527987 RepID=A0A5C5WGS3_9BACT|nr:hypothetical protein CA85_52840 [Allorhodopirellula solitaria]